jgi:hypothetical protein
MAKNVIGLTGLKGVGKSTAAKGLAEDGYKVLSFADPLKDAALTIFDIPESDRDNKQKHLPRWNMTIREIYQILGTEVGRQIDPEVWIKNMASRIERSLCDTIVIDDVRFLNEASFIRDQYQSMIIGIVRRGSDKPKVTDDKHSSETEMVQCWGQITDHVVENTFNGKEQFQEKIANLANELLSE